MGIAFWHAVAAVLAVSHGKDPYCWVNGRTWDRCCGDTGSQHEDSMSNSCWSPLGSTETLGEFSEDRCCRGIVSQADVSFDELPHLDHRRTHALLGRRSLGLVVVRDVPGLELALSNLQEAKDTVMKVTEPVEAGTCSEFFHQLPEHEEVVFHPRAEELKRAGCEFTWERLEDASFRALTQRFAPPQLAPERALYQADAALGRILFEVLRLVLRATDRLLDHAQANVTSLEELLLKNDIANFVHYSYHNFESPQNEFHSRQDLRYDRGRWGILHNWHEDSVWATVQTKPSMRRTDSSEEVAYFDDATFVSDRNENLHRYQLGANDVAIWVGIAVSEMTKGVIRPARHTVLLHELWKAPIRDHQLMRHVTLMHMFPQVSKQFPRDVKQGKQRPSGKATKQIQVPCIRHCAPGMAAASNKYGLRLDIKIPWWVPAY